MMKRTIGILFGSLIFAAASAAATDEAYYCDRSGVIGFQEFKSTLPNRVLPTLQEQLQSYRMASFDIPHKLTPAKAAAARCWPRPPWNRAPTRPRYWKN
jgi:hypothetical protein